MKVKELILDLLAADPDAEVILQKDSEGNGYSPCRGADLAAVYVPESTWSGNVYSLEWTADDACMSEDQWAMTIDAPRCVVLSPVN